MSKEEENSNIITELRAGDVLLGRGNGVTHHPGNIRFRALAEEREEDFDQAPPRVRAMMAIELVNNVHDIGGRFLDRLTYKVNGDYETGWEEVQPSVALDKAKQVLRDRVQIFRKRKKKESEAMKTSSSPPKKPKQIPRTIEIVPNSQTIMDTLPLVQDRLTVSSTARFPRLDDPLLSDRVIDLLHESPRSQLAQITQPAPSRRDSHANDLLQLEVLLLLRQRRLEQERLLAEALGSMARDRPW